MLNTTQHKGYGLWINSRNLRYELGIRLEPAEGKKVINDLGYPWDALGYPGSKTSMLPGCTGKYVQQKK